MFNRKLVKRLRFKLKIAQIAYESCFNEGQAKELKEQDERIEQLRKALETAKNQFTNPEFGVNWQDAADDIDRILKRTNNV